ncbi:MAG TPA: DUF1080 domain-containing protein [Chryseosolibacter sp.]|nr:DUF1080 domain-containing protein [Chryseosolibacter sp.]
MKIYCAAFVLLLLMFLSDSPDATKPRPLFNGKNLKGWETYIGPAYDSAQEKFTGKPFGLDVDPSRVFSVVQVDEKGAIRISGEHFGGISTKESFQNYHLRLEFKWGQKKWHPKKNSARDSGLLYHAVGPHAGDGSFWMRSQEFQIQEGDCGDYWGVAGAFADIPASEKGKGQYVYDPAAPLVTFRDRTPVGRHCIKHPDAENPSGEWNTIDLYCVGDTSVHVVNGAVNMVLYNLRQEDGASILPLTKGKIQIQSEGAEVFYRNISIESIRQIPTALLTSNQ